MCIRDSNNIHSAFATHIHTENHNYTNIDTNLEILYYIPKGRKLNTTDVYKRQHFIRLTLPAKQTSVKEAKTIMPSFCRCLQILHLVNTFHYLHSVETVSYTHLCIISPQFLNRLYSVKLKF